LLRKALERISSVVNEFGSSFCSHSLASSFNEKEKSLSSNGIDGHPIELDGIALCKEFAKMHTGVLKGMSIELLSLHESDQR